MEAMDDPNCEEALDVDLLPTKSKNGISHNTSALSGFDGTEIYSEKLPILSRSASEEGGGEVIDERLNSHESYAGNGNGSANEGSETHNGSTLEHQLSDYLPPESKSDHIVDDTSISRSSYTETSHKYSEISNTKTTTTFSTSSTSTTTHVDHHVDHGIAGNGYSSATVKPNESTIAEEAKEDVLEFDVEKVLQKQETHDLFCPNCNSCITKRVILRRRKRKIQELSPSEENQDIVIPEPPQIPYHPATEQAEEYVEDTRRDAFRCLSCFSIFIPIGRGFKLFSFGGRGSKETIRDSEAAVSASVPAVVTGETGEEQHVGVVSIQEQSQLNRQPEILQEQGGEKEDSMAVQADIKTQSSDVDSMALQAAQTSPTKLHPDDGKKISDAYDTSGPVIAENKAVEGKKEELQILIHEPEAPAAPAILYPPKDDIGIEKISGNQIVSVVSEVDQTVVSMTLPTDISSETESLLTSVNNTGTAPEPVVATVVGDPQLDIIKSVVYGGLLESIASLSVVTSAAGANAKTLNIVALGAANMFGGLFILAHNLRVFKQDTSHERYAEVLGRPGHFTFHSTIAVLSYIVFGLMPPVVFGFTFRESNNRDYKLITVGLASLLCIVLLSVGKAYARTHPRAYGKTIMYYVMLWAMVCGVSYAAGDLFDFVLQKLGWFDSSSSAAMAAW